MIGDLEILNARGIERLKAGGVPTPDEWAAMCHLERLRWERNCKPQVEALIAAGWTFELSDHDLDTWQWAWRRPPRRPGKPGRRFASTQQAYNALLRERGGSVGDVHSSESGRSEPS